ncbi:MAG: hypothetical protein ACUVS5_12865, partial [Anaerolineae bacterium]
MTRRLRKPLPAPLRWSRFGPLRCSHRLARLLAHPSSPSVGRGSSGGAAALRRRRSAASAP